MLGGAHDADIIPMPVLSILFKTQEGWGQLPEAKG
jgi:hypothetical protein